MRRLLSTGHLRQWRQWVEGIVYRQTPVCQYWMTYVRHYVPQHHNGACRWLVLKTVVTENGILKPEKPKGRRSSTIQPQGIGRSPLKPFLTGVRAALATDAQRRDDESDFDFSWRSLYLTSGWMHEEVKLSENATRQMAEFFERIGEDGVLHMLVQSVPASDGTTTLSGVIPLSGDGSMAPALVEWASAEANLVTSTTDIDGWPVYRIADFRDFGIVDHTNLFFVVTDHSVVWIIGTEEAVPLLETIVLREFPPDEEGNVFARSVATVKCDAPSLLKFPAMTEIIDDLLPDRDDEQPLQTGMTLSVTAEPQSLMLTVHFERDAAVVGLMLFESGFITLAELVLDW